MAKTRIANSLGVNSINEGTINNISEERYILDHKRKYCIIDIIPMGAPRMTQRDKWFTNPNHVDPKKRQRPVVTKYFDFKNSLVYQCKKIGFELGDTIDIVCLIPMPDSWSKKKKERMNGLPHKVKPDWDNVAKGIQDALKKSDSSVWKASIEKRWAYNGSIIFFH